MTVNALSDKQIKLLVESNVLGENGPVPLERLKSVSVSYIDFQGLEQSDGEIIVLDAVASRVQKIFDQLLKRRFPIAKIRSLHHYGGDDLLSMKDNNSSCFNNRPIPNSDTLSLHSYGLAIDINPEQNPFLDIDQELGVVSVLPASGWSYLNRRNQKPGMVESIVSLFAENGFPIWGGVWTIPIDYHHFQVPRGLAEILTMVNPEDSGKVFDMACQINQAITNIESGDGLNPLLNLYKSDKSSFFERFSNMLKELSAYQ